MYVSLKLLGVDIDAATKLGIKVARIPGDVTGNAVSCAEMAIYLMLGLLRKQVHHFFMDDICSYDFYNFGGFHDHLIQLQFFSSSLND